jgi:CIC family chloride channel protein
MRRALHHLRHRTLRLLERLGELIGGESASLVVIGAAVGVVAGFASVALVLLVRAVNSVSWALAPALDDVVPTDALTQGGESGLPAAWPLLVVPLGLLTVSWITRRFAPEAAGHGVPEVMAAVAQKSGLMRGKVGVVKLVASAINIGTGGSVGKEGPIVQVGASFGSVCARLLGLHGRHMRTLVGCGAAAGIAAVFNAPIGGVLFALEIVIGAYSLSSFAPVLIASVAGSVTSRRLLGSEPAFAIPESLREGLTITSLWELSSYVAMGLLFGLLSVGFVRVLYAIEDRAHRWSLAWYGKALLAGLLVGAMGMALPEVLGEGHHVMTELLGDAGAHFTWTMLLVLGAVKTLATVITLAGGGSGGVFAPSLFVGAALGGAYGLVLDGLFPDFIGPSGAYALAGMAALLAGTAHAPMTAILLMFEMSDNYLLILPLMTVSVLATVVAQRLLPDSIYTLGLSRRGIVLRDREDTALLKRLRVADAMGPPPESVPDSTTFDRIVRRLMLSDQHDLPVVDGDGRLTGAVSFSDVREFLRDEGLDHLLLARDCAREVQTLAPQDTLLDAMHVFHEHPLQEIPVLVDGRLVGSLRRDDVLSTYRRSLMAASGTS